MNQEYLKELEQLLQSGVDNGIYPGCNYAVVYNDEFYSNSLGYKALLPNKELNNLDTLYDLASLSKVISTTTCILRLMEMGKIRLFDSVKTYLSEFKYDDITIWNLITHTAGFPPGVGGSNKATVEELKQRIYDLPLQYKKGERIVYSDVGFMLLGFVIEKITGKPLDKAAKELVFDPLDMTNTHYNRLPLAKDFDVTNYAPTEERDDEVYVGIQRGMVHDERSFILEGCAGHAGVFSTVGDLVKFEQMILNNGVHNGKKFLSPATLDLIFTPQVKETNGVCLTVNQRGIGWIVGGDWPSCGELASVETIHHTGFTGTSVFMDRINKVGFILLTNRVHPTRQNTKIIPFRGRVGNFVVSHFGRR